MQEDLALAEYTALRATIRERGTLRSAVAALTFLLWAGLALAVALFTAAPLLVLLPLAALAGGFETVLGLHVGVERVGRFIQARYELSSASLPGWEHAAMEFGLSTRAGLALDPLFSALFAGSTALNLLLAARAGFDVHAVRGVGILVVVTVAHALLLLRIWTGRRFAATQRAIELERFRVRPPKAD
ncbi:MAG: hypothetical protein ABI051_15740 [Vicinamibacterales bacterium]